MCLLAVMFVANNRADLKSCLRLCGSLDLPPYSFEAGFIVTKIAALGFTQTDLPAHNQNVTKQAACTYTFAHTLPYT